MANMTETQREQYDRADLSVPTTGVQVRSPRALATYTVLAGIILIVLGIAAISGIDTWWQAVVFGVIILTTIGAMIALNPRRRGY